ncbi:MAG: OmpH family outer membrane protein [Psychrobium sp.]
MKKLATAVTAAALLVGTSFSSASYAFEQKIGVIDMGTIFQNLPQREQLSQNLESEFKERREAVQSIVKKMQDLAEKSKRDAALLTQQQKLDMQREMESLKSDYQLKGKALEEDMRRRGGEEQNKLLLQVQQAVNEVAKEKKYDVILQSNAVAYINKENDISELVAKKVAKSK